MAGWAVFMFCPWRLIPPIFPQGQRSCLMLEKSTQDGVYGFYQPSPWQAPFFIPVQSLDLGDPLCLQVSTARSPAALCALEGSGAVPPSPPLVLVSAFPSVALPARHTICVFTYLWRQLTGACQPAQLRGSSVGRGVPGSCLQLGPLEDCPVFPDWLAPVHTQPLGGF